MALKPRSFSKRSSASLQTTYYEEETNSSKVPSNVHFFNRNLTNLVLVKSQAFNTKKPGGKTTFRIWPQLDIEEPTKLMASGIDPDDPSVLYLSMSPPVYVANYAGLRVDNDVRKLYPKHLKLGPTSFIYAKNMTETIEGIPFWDSPYVSFYMACKNASKGKNLGSKIRWEPAWNRLCTYDNKTGTPAPVSNRLDQAQFAVISLYENGELFNLTAQKVSKYNRETQKYEDSFVDRKGIPYGEAEDDPVVVLQMGAAAARELVKFTQFGKIQSDVEPMLTNPFKDPVGVFDEEKLTVNGGLFYTLYDGRNAKMPDPNSAKAVYTEGEIAGYAVAVSNKYQGPNGIIKPSLNSAQVENVLNKNLFMWAGEDADPKSTDYLLRMTGIEEQCELMAHAYYPAGKLLNFAWATYPEYLAFDSVRAVLQNRRSFVLVQTIADAADRYLVGNLNADEDDDEAPQATPKRKVVDDRSVSTEDLLEEDDERPPVKAKKQVTQFEDEEFESVKQPVKKAKKQVTQFEEEDEEEEEKPKSKILKEPTMTKAAKAKPAQDIWDDDEELEEEVEEESFGEEEEESDDFEAEETNDKLNKSLAKAKAIETDIKKPKRRFSR